MLGFVHLMLSYSPLSSGFHSSPSIEFQRVMWHCLTLCLQNTLLFQPPPFSLCFYPIFSAHMHAIWQYTRILSLPPSLFVSLAYSPLDSPLPSVNRECIVSLQILSVLAVLSVGITMMDWNHFDICHTRKWMLLLTVLSLAFTKTQGYLVRCVSQFFCLYI